MKYKIYSSWVEIDCSRLKNNIRLFRDLIGRDKKLLVVVKSNAYGHGMAEISKVAISEGADWLGVFSLDEGISLREEGIMCPILVMGYIPFKYLQIAVEENMSLGVPSLDSLKEICKKAKKTSKIINIHLKLETGLNRLGISECELWHVKELLNESRNVRLEGLYTHYANIEDTLHHDFAHYQLSNFAKMCEIMMEKKNDVLRHTACTAAAILFPKTYFEMARVGIGTYGMWPSKETLITALETKKNILDLKPVLTWKSRIMQLKKIKPGETVGYGCSYRVTRPGKIAVIPVGYADGYDRKMSGKGYILVKGKEAPIVGRVCMNMFMTDVTHIQGVKTDDEVVLLGSQNAASVSAEYMSEVIGTINYEVTTRINPAIPRIMV